SPWANPGWPRVGKLCLFPLREVFAELGHYLSAHTCPRYREGVSPRPLSEHALYPPQTQRSHAPSGVRGRLWAGEGGKLRIACGKRSTRYSTMVSMDTTAVGCPCSSTRGMYREPSRLIWFNAYTSSS